VRTNRYLYRSTYLHSANFEYNAEPKRILFGRIIVVLFYGLFLFFSDFLGMFSVAAFILLLFILLLPWLLRQAISFRLKNTSYRNIPFCFTAKTRNFYAFFAIVIITFILLPIALVILAKVLPDLAAFLSFFLYIILFVLIIPFFYRHYKRLVINGAWYGVTPFQFIATKRDTIFLFIKIGLWTLLLTSLLGIVTAIIIEVGANFPELQNLKQITQSSYGTILATLFGTILYLFTIGLYKGVIDASLSNFIRNHSTIKDGHFKGTLHPLKLAWISASNALLLLFSLGLLYPWTKIRYLKYKIENSFFACTHYDAFLSNGYEKSNPLGEEILDFFDIDIGF